MNDSLSPRLLVAVVNDRERLDEILAGFLEIGITGATVVPSEGMGRVLSQDIPVFAGLQTLLSGSRPQNLTIFSVIPASKVDAAIELLQEVAGSLVSPGTGIAFTLPIDRVVGLAARLGENGDPS